MHGYHYSGDLGLYAIVCKHLKAFANVFLGNLLSHYVCESMFTTVRPARFARAKNRCPLPFGARSACAWKPMFTTVRPTLRARV